MPTPAVPPRKRRRAPVTPASIVVVAGSLRVDPAHRDAFVERSLPSVVAARRTPGCLDFVVAADPLEPDRVNILERWKDRASLERFRGSGPDDGLGALILAFAVEEYRAVPLDG